MDILLGTVGLFCKFQPYNFKETKCPTIHTFDMQIENSCIKLDN